MTIQTREVAVERALAKKTNVEGMCQQVTRGYFDAPSAGDRDGDKDADANDGWLAEPAWARHPGDRDFPAGVPLYFRNADGTGSGHRALGVEDQEVRSTDFNGKTKKWSAGVMGTGTLEEIEKAMGLVYVGWSETITGFKIPQEPKPTEETKGPRRGTEVYKAKERLSHARDLAVRKGFTSRAGRLATIIKKIDELPEGS